MADVSDKKAPDTVAKLEGKATSNSIDLTWKHAKDDKKVLGYYIYVNDTLVDYIGGDKSSYTISGLNELTEYTVYVVAVDYNMNESKDSKKIIIKTKADEQKPVAQFVNVTDKNTITVKYSKDMNKESAEDIVNYTLNYNISILSAALSDDLRTVTLKTSDIDFDSGKRFSLTVMGAKDNSYTGNRAERKKFVLEPNIAGYWSFDENKGNKVYDSSGIYTKPGMVYKAEWTKVCLEAH